MIASLYISLAVIFAVAPMTSFLDEQLKYPRVAQAFAEKEKQVSDFMSHNGLDLADIHLLLIAYKDEDILEVHAKSSDGHSYQLIKTYNICARSGSLGPKRREGDMQVPEGFYEIDRFNPNSAFHLSLGINYPNASDRIKSDRTKPGGDIFIHGGCNTVGCLPMSDETIKKIYVMAVHARNTGQHKIPVYVFPFRMTDENMDLNLKKVQIDFWKNIKHGYDKWILEKKEINYSVDKAGNYSF